MNWIEDFDVLSVCSRFREIILNEYNSQEYFKGIFEILHDEYKNFKIFPPKCDVFNAFKYKDFDEIKVVIIGQDPYNGENQAHGLSFSVLNSKIPSSLKNIFKELSSDININILKHGNLISWANQGVLLLNSTLTVRKSLSNSHKLIGWSKFTDKIIKLLSDERINLVFILWGNFAIQKSYLIDKNKHLVIKSSHPSGLSAHRGFFSSKPFSKANEYLEKNFIKGIDWEIR